MRIDTNIKDASSKVSVTHGDQKLEFSISTFKKRRLTSDFDVFQQINAFWASRTESEQKKIFDIYSDIHGEFVDTFKREPLKDRLKVHVNKLLTLNDLEVIGHWAAFSNDCNMQIPESVPQVFVEDINRNLTVSKTYTEPEYRRLAVLSLALRCMIPVWGEYLHVIKNDTADAIMDMVAFQLVDDIYNSSVPAVAKLMDYISSNLGSLDNEKFGAIFIGIPTVDFPRWLLSMIAINCLTTSDIRGNNPNAHLATFIYTYIKAKTSPKDDPDNSKIKPKTISEDDGNENNTKASALERYKVKSNISVSDMVEAEYCLSNYEAITEQLAPGFDRFELSQAMDRLRNHKGDVKVPQVDLLRWVLSRVVSKEILLYMPADLIKNLLAVLETVLWTRGHKYLAVLSTCYPVLSDNEMSISPIDSKMRIPEAEMEELARIFRYTRNTSNKKAVVKESNLAIESLDILTSRFSSFAWKPTSTQERIIEVLGFKSTRFTIKPDIKTSLARLIIDLQNIQY